MKVTDYNIITQEIERQLVLGDFSLPYIVGHDIAVWMIASIYLAGDQTKAFTMHVETLSPILGDGDITIITTPYKLSTIYRHRSTRWEQRETPIVTYHDLADDIADILLIIQLDLTQIM